MKPRPVAPILFLALACSSVATTPPPVVRDGATTSPGHDGAVDVPKSALPDAARESGLAAGACRDESDCGQFQRCYVPDPRIMGGGDAAPACYQNCQTDQDCNRGGGHGSICSVSPACSTAYDRDGGQISDIRVCVPGCRVVNCWPEETCGADDHCAPTTCTRDADCPTNFACTPGDGGAPICRRRACTSDSQCQGACVESRCYDELGRCGGLPV
jgi:hypothetical protein